LRELVTVYKVDERMSGIYVATRLVFGALDNVCLIIERNSYVIIVINHNTVTSTSLLSELSLHYQLNGKVK
jgi:hypothetical protein